MAYCKLKEETTGVRGFICFLKPRPPSLKEPGLTKGDKLGDCGADVGGVEEGDCWARVITLGGNMRRTEDHSLGVMLFIKDVIVVFLLLSSSEEVAEAKACSVAATVI